MASKISVQKSRFALLKIEDSDDEDAFSSKKIQKATQQQSGGSKKKNKKKKSDVQSDNAELKHLAFGQPVAKQKQGASGKKNKQNNTDQWEEWKKLDTEFTADAFEKDLQQALLSSKLEYEQQTQGKKNQPVNGTVKVSGDEKEEKKKKNKSKPVPMTLEQFNQLETVRNKIHSSSSDEEAERFAPPPPQTRVPDYQADSKFFDRVQADVDRILTQEKMQTEYKKQYAMENVIVRKYENEVRKKDKEITMLRATVKKLEEELKQVKQRNKQLCHILGQGEMKDKAEVLLQIDELLQVKDELTEQVTLLTADLEKERSKVHGLKSEVDRIKGSKHGGK